MSPKGYSPSEPRYSCLQNRNFDLSNEAESLVKDSADFSGCSGDPFGVIVIKLMIFLKVNLLELVVLKSFRNHSNVALEKMCFLISICFLDLVWCWSF